jgi:hypothetical protein
MRLRAILIALALAFVAKPAEARRINGKFLMDFAPGISVPIANDSWTHYADPSFKFSLRIGGELWFTRHFAFAGEVDLDPQPQMRTDGAVLGRVRTLVGFRLVFGFGIGAFYIRHAIGVDWLQDVPTLNPRSGEAVLAVEPGVGLQFHVARHLVVGFDNAFPIGFFHNPLLAVDVQFLGFLGLRI